MPDKPLEDLMARLERERLEADRRYNDALTALDRAIGSSTHVPAAPSRFDYSGVPELNGTWDVLPAGAPPIDGSLKGRLRGFIWRLVGPPLDTQRRFNASLVEHLNRNAAASEEVPRALTQLIETVRTEFEALVRFESLLVQYLQTVTEYIDSKDRRIGAGDLRERVALVELRVLALKRELESAGTGPAPAAAVPGEPKALFAGNVDSSTYLGFEDRFRGEMCEIRGRVEDYVGILAGTNDVLDVGCGRGELLAALEQAGIGARGIDANEAMVQLCRLQGLRAEQGDALGYLSRLADASIGGLTAIQVVEHFEPAYLARFLETAHHKMRPGAPLVLETINPACWMAFFETYIRDLTHQRPLHPDTLKYLVQASGFTAVDVQFRQPVGEGDRLEHVTLGSDAAGQFAPAVAQIAEALNAHADKLNARLFSSMDYVVIARR